MAGRDPHLNIDLNDSQFASYDVENGQYVFYVEQGTPFHLKFVSDTYLPPSANDVELYKNGQHLPRVQGGTIFLDGDSMDIQRVDQRYKGAYTIKTSRGGELSFRLKVKDTPAYSQPPDPDKGYLWR